MDSVIRSKFARVLQKNKRYRLPLWHLAIPSCVVISNNRFALPVLPEAPVIPIGPIGEKPLRRFNTIRLNSPVGPVAPRQKNRLISSLSQKTLKVTCNS